MASRDRFPMHASGDRAPLTDGERATISNAIPAALPKSQREALISHVERAVQFYSSTLEAEPEGGPLSQGERDTVQSEIDALRNAARSLRMVIESLGLEARHQLSTRADVDPATLEDLADRASLLDNAGLATLSEIEAAAATPDRRNHRAFILAAQICDACRSHTSLKPTRGSKDLPSAFEKLLRAAFGVVGETASTQHMARLAIAAHR